MAESTAAKVKNWIKRTLAAMGDAVFSEKSKSTPPETGEQPFKDTPKKGLF